MFSDSFDTSPLDVGADVDADVGIITALIHYIRSLGTDGEEAALASLSATDTDHPGSPTALTRFVRLFCDVRLDRPPTSLMVFEIARRLFFPGGSGVFFAVYKPENVQTDFYNCTERCILASRWAPGHPGTSWAKCQRVHAGGLLRPGPPARAQWRGRPPPLGRYRADPAAVLRRGGSTPFLNQSSEIFTEL